jgi:hypothetical protein
MSENVCGGCGHRYRVDFKFCPHCGDRNIVRSTSEWDYERPELIGHTSPVERDLRFYDNLTGTFLVIAGFFLLFAGLILLHTGIYDTWIYWEAVGMGSALIAISIVLILTGYFATQRKHRALHYVAIALLWLLGLPSFFVILTGGIIVFLLFLIFRSDNINRDRNNAFIICLMSFLGLLYLVLNILWLTSSPM